MNSISFSTGRLSSAADLIRTRTSLGDTPAVEWCWTDDGRFSMKPQSGYAMSSGERVLYDILNSLVYGHPVSLYNLIVLDAETRRVAWEAIGIAAGIEGIAHLTREGRLELVTERKDHDS